MAIVDKLNQLQADIRDAYDSVTEKGGVVPVHQNTHNIATAIDSIPTSPTFTSNGFANDSWETICAIANANLAPKYYSLGDSKVIHLSNSIDATTTGKNIVEGDYVATIVGFNNMNLADKNGTGNLTIMLTSSNYQAQRNDWQVPLSYSYYSWAGAGSLVNWLNDTVKASLPQVVQQNLVRTKQCVWNNYSHQVGYNNLYVTTVNGYNLGVDYISSFTGVDGSEATIRDLQQEHTLGYFADYGTRRRSFLYELLNGVGMSVVADTTENWYYLVISRDLSSFSRVNNSNPSNLRQVNILPIFTIGG